MSCSFDSQDLNNQNESQPGLATRFFLSVLCVVFLMVGGMIFFQTMGYMFDRLSSVSYHQLWQQFLMI